MKLKVVVYTSDYIGRTRYLTFLIAEEMTQDNCLDCVENSANEEIQNSDVTKETESGTSMCATEDFFSFCLHLMYTF